jgi:hypothetical protein
MPALPDAALEALWKNVVDRWDGDAAHAAFLEHCQRAGQLAEAAARYRGMTGDHVRGPSARKRLQGVATLAVLSLEASRTPARETSRKASQLVLVVLFLAAAVALAAYMGSLTIK